jgi:hypothetical protein
MYSSVLLATIVSGHPPEQFYKDFLQDICGGGGALLMPSAGLTMCGGVYRATSRDIRPGDGHEACFVTNPALGKQAIFVCLD